MQKNVYEFISKQTADPIVERKTCRVSGEPFAVFQSDIDFYKKITVGLPGQPRSPAGKSRRGLMPTRCPRERQRRRLAWRNERFLYRRTCDFSGKPIITVYHPASPFPVYSPEARYADTWNPLSYAQDIAVSTSFFSQYDQLQNKVPKLSLIRDTCENCEYTQLTADSKNCYLIYGSIQCEDCMYGSPYRSKNCYDSLVVHNSDSCYECIDSEKLYACFFCQNCSDSHHLWFCQGLVGCSSCIGCIGLVNKEYCVFNVQYTKEDWLTFYHRMNLEDPVFISNVQQQLRSLQSQIPQKNLMGTNNEGVIGDYVFNSRAAVHLFSAESCEDVRYSSYVTEVKKAMDVDFGEYSPGGIYETVGFYKVDHIWFSHWIRNGAHDLLYCSTCFNQTHHCFGCVGLRNASYCILNKQYTRQTREELVPKLITRMQESGERGEFFSPSLSDFCYNETAANDYFPRTKEEALQAGYRWRDEQVAVPAVSSERYLSAEKIPSITTAGDDILNKIFLCQETGKQFKILKPEFAFYKEHNLPLPKLHPDQRHGTRVKKKNPRQLRTRQCACCSKEMLTSYAPEKSEKVYCEKCYTKEVYG